MHGSSLPMLGSVALGGGEQGRRRLRGDWRRRLRVGGGIGGGAGRSGRPAAGLRLRRRGVGGFGRNGLERSHQIRRPAQ
ncbi:Os05g0384700 [Oryza sativa Japonica Group]|uniref:Os05g0384700 protein n=1 Tax=Oryza sativa subsp. japonica TaxID=39947 RepID=Q0DIJ4_ORYSJ|nr:Os05g0384700 [Oryza sativa Japonica Group]|eukprot:NP_001055415.1 Os05g0384700 [Oryza sativa Japonica Group]